MNVPALMATYQLRQREYLLQITRAMTSRLELPSLLTLILSSAAEMVAAPAGLIVLNEDGDRRSDENGVEIRHGTVQIRAAYGIPRELLPAFQPLLENSSTLDVIDESGREAEEEEFLSPGEMYRQELEQRVRAVEEKLGKKLGQVLGLPLRFEDDYLGIIYLFRGGSAFSKLDWQVLEGFAFQAAIAVRNARLYQQLATERSRLAAIVQNSADGIMILSPDGRVQVINQALAAMTGIGPADAIGLSCDMVLPLRNVEGDNFCSGDVDIDLLEAGGLRCEGDLERPGGGHVTVAVTFTPLTGENGRLVNVIVNVIDITRFREEEEMKSTFISIMSHELKTPVALIKGYAQTLARPDAEWDAGIARQSLEIVEEEADRLEALINNLLDASRIQAGGLRLDLTDVNLLRLLERIAQDYRTQTEKHVIELDLATSLPVINADEERLRQVFTNLLNNAIKYSPEGGTIRLGGWVEPYKVDEGHKRRIVLYVADEGIGIPEDELPRIFERFYRVDSGLRRSTAGVGIGLFLIQAIIEAHGGEVWVRSEVGKGTTFFIALPLEDEESEETDE